MGCLDVLKVGSSLRTPYNTITAKLWSLHCGLCSYLLAISLGILFGRLGPDHVWDITVLVLAQKDLNVRETWVKANACTHTWHWTHIVIWLHAKARSFCHIEAVSPPLRGCACHEQAYYEREISSMHAMPPAAACMPCKPGKSRTHLQHAWLPPSCPQLSAAWLQQLLQASGTGICCPLPARACPSQASATLSVAYC